MEWDIDFWHITTYFGQIVNFKYGGYVPLIFSNF